MFLKGCAPKRTGIRHAQQPAFFGIVLLGPGTVFQGRCCGDEPVDQNDLCGEFQLAPFQHGFDHAGQFQQTQLFRRTAKGKSTD